MKKYYKNNRERLSQYNKERNSTDEAREGNRKRYKESIERYRGYARSYYEKHQAQLLAAKREDYHNNPDQKEYAKQWCKNNREKRREFSREHYERNREAMLLRAKQIIEQCPDHYIEAILRQQGIDTSCLPEEERTAYVEIRRKLILLRRLTLNV